MLPKHAKSKLGSTLLAEEHINNQLDVFNRG
jgi:hypothetical protein